MHFTFASSFQFQNLCFLSLNLNISSYLKQKVSGYVIPKKTKKKVEISMSHNVERALIKY